MKTKNVWMFLLLLATCLVGSSVFCSCSKDDVEETHEFVDLGLPSGTLWATCNVGANSPEEYGDYFAWAETEPKVYYSLSTYKYCKGNMHTKYYTTGSYGSIVDNKTELEAMDDAATVNWGCDWQMPSYEQFEELINSSYTTTTWTTMNGKYGRKITSKSNGNSIFLPAVGYCDEASLDCVGDIGYYWSRSLGTSVSDINSYCLIFYSSDIRTTNFCRYWGYSVRPVRVNVQTIELNHTELPVVMSESTQLSATVLPENATNKTVVWTSSNTDIASVDETGKVTAVAGGICTIICSTTDGTGVKAECKLIVLENISNTIDGREYVDLGLPSGTLWATCNVGANSPGEYGDYFDWGETKPKSTYDWSIYKYCNGTGDSMTKYCTSSSDGTVDNKNELESSNDAATVIWGRDWQMPSEEQCEELINSSYTTTTWTTMNGEYGRKITSMSNGNSIFLPAAGYRGGTSLNNAGSDGYYWSRSLCTGYNNYACSLHFDSSDINAYDYRRCYGRSVRPVRVKK